MSTPHSKVGHNDLQLDSYTWASSPMRRYMDIIVQRLLHSVLEKNTPSVKYTSKEIDLFCARFQEKCEKKAKFDTHVQILKTVNHLSRQSTQMMAIVNHLDPVGHNFQVSIPLNQVSMSQTLSIMYRHLKLIDQPKYDEKSQSMTLKWKCRVYSFTNTQIQSECLGAQMNMHVTPVQTDTWQHIVSALREEDWETVVQCVQSIKSSMDGKRELREESFNVQHHTEISLDLKVGRSLPVQLGTDTMCGQTFPAVQLVNINPQFEICVQHSKDPIKCFSEPPLQGSKKAYRSYNEYKDIWGKLCAVETAYNAVAENDSIIFEDVKITWHRQSAKQTLQGNFRLSLKQKQQWSIECDLKNCFLCVRLRDQTIDMQEDLHLSEIFPPWDLEEPQSFTWVAHGVTTKTSNATESKRLSYVQTDFILHHFSMENIPKSIFSENVKFTVELIPKKLPYVLNEHAIANLTHANCLVKSIVMGNKALGTISENSREKFESEDGHLPGFSPLNDSQKDAIKRALERPFTLIQGPPGTGKTVVGIHIVYWFFMKNQEAEATIPNTQDTKQPFKKNAILYCGPSNKSVDIVAEQVLKLKGVRPLRVYSDQIEMLEFPYPGSHLKVCRKSLREEKPNEALRKITLRYLIRKQDNPYADKITSFEKIIQTEKEVDDVRIAGYKKLLNEARQHELRKHDVILCTCSSASDPNFLKTMNFRQILIDECAMATEPEALIPLVAHSPEQIVLLGDHKQIRPIVECELMKKLGMKTSLFERYMEDAVMLDTQYRMHEGICKFPSWKFYKDSLKTEGEHELSALCSPSNKQTPILFGHVEGREVGLLVSTEKGNENSTANVEEAEEVVRVAKEVKDVTVCTIMKSQGSEWRYVILSTVRSCPISDINKELPRPTKAWLSKRLGFVIDPNLVNVGITRAQDGLCIIGNKNLLRCNELWRELLEHYEKLNCVVDPAKGIQVLNTKHKQKAKQKK
ncbi:hypothetical protein AGOR_G00168690 [Albula goreensis]|uniref:Uncharacterized protein n=1 Tax=Albula goreensis TaxID=1534307 RepID=A0A8T3CXD8_9TELE|nr:hypothetical protein AGOR_G00168690 [Albula goreensis]